MNYRHYYCSPKYSEKEKSYFGTVKDLPGARPIEADTIDSLQHFVFGIVFPVGTRILDEFEIF